MAVPALSAAQPFLSRVIAHPKDQKSQVFFFRCFAVAALLVGVTNLASAAMFSGIEYGRAGGDPLLLDARIPEGAGPFPAAIIVHGGGWVGGDRLYSVQPLFQPLADASIATFSISYRLAGDLVSGKGIRNNPAALLTLGTAVDDVRQAIAFIKAHASEYHIDPTRIALVGESAGAHLAAMAALRPGDTGGVQAVVCFYGPSDLLMLARTSPQIPDSLRNAIKGSPWETLLTAGLRELSPVTWVHKDAPPFLLIHGTDDTLVPYAQSVELCNRLHSVGSACRIYPVRGGNHGIRWWESRHLTAYKEVLVDWLQSQLGHRV